MRILINYINYGITELLQDEFKIEYIIDDKWLVATI